MGEDVTRGRGRPKKDERKLKSKTVKIRMTNDDFKKLERIAKWAEMSNAETIRTLISRAEEYHIRD